jgi:hypothetical protein
MPVGVSCAMAWSPKAISIAARMETLIDLIC